MQIQLDQTSTAEPIRISLHYADAVNLAYILQTFILQIPPSAGTSNFANELLFHLKHRLNDPYFD